MQDGADDDARDPRQVAAYVAKYSCKGSHEQIIGRGASPEQLRERGGPEQLVQMAMAAIRLSERAGLGAVGQWTHMLGFRGHLVTKSPYYSRLLVSCATPALSGEPTATTPSSRTTLRRCCRSGSTWAAGTSIPATCSWRRAVFGVVDGSCGGQNERACR